MTILALAGFFVNVFIWVDMYRDSGFLIEDCLDTTCVFKWTLTSKETSSSGTLWMSKVM